MFSISAAASPQWRFRESILAAARRKARFSGPDRLALGLAAFGVAAGVPATLGFVDGNVLLILGALAACMIGRGLASGKTAPLSVSSAAGWFAVVSWSVVANLLLASEGLGLRRALAAQAVTGPPLWSSEPAVAATAAAALAAGLVAAVCWASRLQPLVDHEEMAAAAAVLRWGETALVAAAVAATAWGPSLGALVHGPGQAALAGASTGSFLATCAAVGAVSFGRRYAGRLANTPVLAAAAAVSFAALLASLALR